MKLLVNGCSFSRGPISWPYYLQALIDCELVNLAQSGAGNSYIHETTVSELAVRDYDLVIIMWSGLSRLDFKVEHPSQFSKTPFTSAHQHLQNDWPTKVILPVNDQDYVEKDWVFGCGILNNEQELVKTNFLNGLYRYIGADQFTHHTLQKVIALQSFLKSRNQRYLFTFYQNYVSELQQSPLYQLLDTDCIVFENLYDITTRTGDFDTDGLHPGPIAAEYFANILATKI